MKIEPYLFFDGRCEEAMHFYEKALGAKLEFLSRYKESPEPPGPIPPGFEEKVIHATLRIGDEDLMASDDCTGANKTFEGFCLSITAPDESRARTVFGALAEGGKVTMPLTKTYFSPCFGMLTDRFGVGWMVIVRA